MKARFGACAVMVMTAISLGACSASESKSAATTQPRSVGESSAADSTAATFGEATSTAAAMSTTAAANDAGGNPAVATTTIPSAGGTPVAAEAFRAIVWNAGMTIVTLDVPGVLTKIRDIAATHNASVSDESSTLGETPKGHLTIKSPPRELKALQDDIAALGTVTERTQKGQDVTLQVVDLDARIKTQQESVARTREFMTRTQNLGELAQMEGELTRRQSDLESMIAQQQSLANQVGLATLTVTVQKTPDKPAEIAKAKPGKSFVAKIPGVGHALAAGGHAAWVVLRLILVGLAYGLAFIGLLSPLVFVAWRRRRMSRASRLAGAGGTPSPGTPPTVMPPPPVTL